MFSENLVIDGPRRYIKVDRKKKKFNVTPENILVVGLVVGACFIPLGIWKAIELFLMICKCFT
jgi:hypothetical protein